MSAFPQEKLGSFYLGAKYDVENKSIVQEFVNYDARDLTTHAICVGMTGSGKTGLCIGLLEEAAIDKVPAIIIDPKGDMTNLMLQFENLEAKDFEKWINADDAGRKGMTKSEYAESMANKWKEGLADWGQDADRIKSLKAAVDYTIYTPGSDSGVPINIMGSFSAPNIDFDSDAEMLRERIQGTVAALLGMVNSKADPVRSPEGILLATLFEHHWRNNEDLDLTKLIKGIQSPPFSQLGVFDVDTFYPEKERFKLAMDFNSLVASPQFAYWLQGEDLDIEKIYYTEEGKPRHSIFYIAHLSESERMFFTTLLLNSLITWMRSQSGTTSLRSLLYFDEIFGYFPPTQNPPTKKPLLTILKQARAYGVGAVLVTQNPVDIDYKGLSNAGTWFIGKLQTERDKMRVLEGLEGAIAESGNNSNSDFDKIITGLSSRVFLMHNVHDDHPIVYHTRWAMSYLRGPMTRPQVKELMQAKRENLKAKQNIIRTHSSIDEKEDQTRDIAVAPTLDPSIDQKYFGVWKSAFEARQALGGEGDYKIAYRPMLITTAKVRFYDSKRNIDEVKDYSYLSEAPDDFGRIDWKNSKQVLHLEKKLFSDPDHPQDIEIEFGAISDSMNSPKELKQCEKDFSDYLYQNQRLVTYEHKDLDLFQAVGETDKQFLIRVKEKAKELRDEELDEIKEKYEPKFDRIYDKMRKEERDLEEAKAESRDRKTAEWVGMAETVFSVFVKGRSRSISSAATKRRMARKAKEKVAASKEDLIELNEDLQDLEQQLKEKLNDIADKWDKAELNISSIEVKPRRTDVKVDNVIVTWTPFWKNANNESLLAIEM